MRLQIQYTSPFGNYASIVSKEVINLCNKFIYKNSGIYSVTNKVNGHKYIGQSKNIYQRRKENDMYLKIKNKILSTYNYNKKKYKDRNTYMYKKCPNCRQKIRLPLKKGKHTVKCPKCSNKFEVKCHKNEKIKVEIVK